MQPNLSFISKMAGSLLLTLGLSCTSPPSKKSDKEIKVVDNSKLLGLGYGINSATILVKNLDSARNYYTKVLGFNMSKPEKFQKGIYEGTLIASVGLPDGFAIELLGAKDTAVVKAKHAFVSSFLKNDQGVRLFSISTSSVDTTLSWLHTQGIKTDSITVGRSTKEVAKGWDWDDGGPEWRNLDFDANNPPAYLPNFIEYIGYPYKDMQEDWKPYAWRKWYNLANGVVGIRSLQIAVPDLKAASNEFKKIGFTILETTDSIVKIKIAHSQELHLINPKTPTDEKSKFLKARGAGVYSIRFEIKNYKETLDFLKKKLSGAALVADSLHNQLTIPAEYAYGVQLEFAEESKEQAALAKIYSFKEGTKLDTVSVIHASAIYTKYCALCHGKDREGYAADFAPSLKSHELMATTQIPRSSYNYLEHTISYGRSGTAMAPYAKSQGGPLDRDDIDLLLQWLHESSGVKKPIELPTTKPVNGNVALGKTLYTQHCAACHGVKGEGVRAPALANAMFLATASDAFLRYTISEGRHGTPMPSFKDSLNKTQIDALTAYVRSRASGWDAPEPISITDPSPADYILNPHSEAPKFKLKEDKYVSAEQLLKALKDSARMIILDARSKAAWQQTRIPGSVSVPYYAEPDKFVKDIPNDSTWVVAYCACPHAASTMVINTLRRLGYKHTAILDEGVLAWAQRGYPVRYGGNNSKSKKK